ncbi:lipocalin-like [Sceloporus undulatus]|uniref:lipocalin-like n=1 Tax=Sceloporus undulatus TaxID=8520 RepID=UPI001C4D6E53|nr:lipocalin-like [Sceloporus undulatus]
MQSGLLAFWGLALVSLVQAQAQVPVQADFQQGQFLGRWFSVGFASNSRWFQEKKSSMKMCSTEVTPTSDGDLEVISTYPKGDKCETRKSLFVRTEEPGRFSYTSSYSGTTSDVRVVETNYHEYALLFAQKVKDGQTSTWVTLYGRSKELRPELLEKFTRLALEQGLTRENILLLPRTDLCIQDSV